MKSQTGDTHIRRFFGVDRGGYLALEEVEKLLGSMGFTRGRITGYDYELFSVLNMEVSYCYYFLLPSFIIETKVRSPAYHVLLGLSFT